MTRVAKMINDIVDQDPRSQCDVEGDRIRWFRACREIVEYLRRHAPRAEDEKLWASATHLMSNPTENSYLRSLGLLRRPYGLTRALETVLVGLVQPNPESSNASQTSFNFIDLFAGIGGFNLALTRSGGKCVFASEWDDAARVTYAMNFGKIPFGDIRHFTRNGVIEKNQSIVYELIPKADIITAGFPCQPFSQAGVTSRNFHGGKHGLNCEAQGTLFEDILIVARATKPKVLLLENVSNLPRHDQGRTLGVIVREIEKSGYTVFPRLTQGKQSGWAVIDSQTVVAQRRRRVYIVCVRNDIVQKKGNFTFPTFDLPEPAFALEGILKLDDSMSDRQKFNEYSISRKLWMSHLDRERRHKERGNGFRIGLVQDLSGPAPTLVARYYKDGKDCLIPNPYDPTLPPRMLSPRECAALQTFPIDFWIPKSRTSAYKQFGNSITVEVAARIVNAIANQYLD